MGSISTLARSAAPDGGIDTGDIAWSARDRGTTKRREMRGRSKL
jgi:hypothetical protein